MKKLALGLATAGTLAAVYVMNDHTATYQPVDCSVHVNHQGSNVDVTWC